MPTSGSRVTRPDHSSATRREIDTKVDSALGDLFTNAPGSRRLFDSAQGVLIFPEVLTAGFIVGGSHGNGALRKGNATLGYYSLNSGSVGLLAGAQSRTLYMFFMTPAALARFQQSDGWTAGGDAFIVQSRHMVKYWRERGVTVPIEVVGRPINPDIFSRPSSVKLPSCPSQ